MRIPKPRLSQRHLLPVNVDVHWCEDGTFLPIAIYYPQHTPGDVEAVEIYSLFKIEVVDAQPAADPDLGVCGTKYTIDVEASANRTVRTEIWYDDTKWLVAAKV